MYMNYDNSINLNHLSYQPMPFFDDNMENNLTQKSQYNRKLDLNLYCIKRPQQTCFIRVSNPDMLAWGIEQGDMLVVEKQDNLFEGDLVVLKNKHNMDIYELMLTKGNEFVFFSLSSKTPNIKTDSLEKLDIVGTITSTIHQIKSRSNPVVKFAA